MPPLAVRVPCQFVSPSIGRSAPLPGRCLHSILKGRRRIALHAKPVAGNEPVTLDILRHVTRKHDAAVQLDFADAHIQTFIRHRMQGSPSFWTVELAEKGVQNAFDCREWMEQEQWESMLLHLSDSQALHKYKMFIHTNFTKQISRGHAVLTAKEKAMDVISSSPWLLAETNPEVVGLRLLDLLDASLHVSQLCEQNNLTASLKDFQWWLQNPWLTRNVLASSEATRAWFVHNIKEFATLTGCQVAASRLVNTQSGLKLIQASAHSTAPQMQQFSASSGISLRNTLSAAVRFNILYRPLKSAQWFHITAAEFSTDRKVWTAEDVMEWMLSLSTSSYGTQVNPGMFNFLCVTQCADIAAAVESATGIPKVRLQRAAVEMPGSFFRVDSEVVAQKWSVLLALSEEVPQWKEDLASKMSPTKSTVRDTKCEHLLKLLGASPRQLQRLFFILCTPSVYRRHMALTSSAALKQKQVNKLGGKAVKRSVPQIRHLLGWAYISTTRFNKILLQADAELIADWKSNTWQTLVPLKQRPHLEALKSMQSTSVK